MFYHFVNGENNGPRLRYEIPRHHAAATKISGWPLKLAKVKFDGGAK
jgi:hypothetical protein